MANIRQYENQQGLTPDDRATQAADRAGRASGAALQSVGQNLGEGIANLGAAYAKHKAQEEISRGMAGLAELQDNVTSAWDVTLKNADPNDPTTAEKFREEQVNPIIDSWASFFETEEGKLWAQSQSFQLRQHFYEKTAADQATMAGSAVVSNLEKFVDHTSNMVLMDPTALPLALGTFDQTLDALLAANINLKPAQIAQIKSELRLKARETLTQSAFIGMARANPDAAMAALQKGFGQGDLNGKQRDDLFGFAETIKRSYEADARAAKAEAKEAEKAAAAADAAKITATLIQPDGSLKVGAGYFSLVAEYLAAHPDAEEGRAMMNMGRTVLEDGDTAVTDPGTYQNFAKRMVLDRKNPNALTMKDVYQARADRKISSKDFTFFKQSIDDLQDPAKSPEKKDFHEFLESNKAYITKSSLMSADAFGDQRYYEFYSWAQQYRDRSLAAGATEQQVREIIRRELPKFVPSQAQAREYMARQARGDLQPLPPLQYSNGGQAPAPTSAAPAKNPGLSAARMKELDDIANGRK